MGQSEQNGSCSDQWSHFPSSLDCYLASFEPYLLLMLMHMSLLHAQLLWNKFSHKRSRIWKPVVTYSWYTLYILFSDWCAQYITWYTRHIISNVTFTFWKTWYNHFSCVIPGISHEKRSLIKNFFSQLLVSMQHHRNSSILEYHICAVQSSFVLELSRFSRFAMELVNQWDNEYEKSYSKLVIKKC